MIAFLKDILFGKTCTYLPVAKSPHALFKACGGGAHGPKGPPASNLRARFRTHSHAYVPCGGHLVALPRRPGEAACARGRPYGDEGKGIQLQFMVISRES